MHVFKLLRCGKVCACQTGEENEMTTERMRLEAWHAESVRADAERAARDWAEMEQLMREAVRGQAMRRAARGMEE